MNETTSSQCSSLFISKNYWWECFYVPLHPTYNFLCVFFFTKCYVKDALFLFLWRPQPILFCLLYFAISFFKYFLLAKPIFILITLLLLSNLLYTFLKLVIVFASFQWIVWIFLCTLIFIQLSHHSIHYNSIEYHVSLCRSYVSCNP